MSITKEQILNTISEMSVMEIMELVAMIEKKFGVSANNIINSNTSKNEKEEKSEFNVILKNFGNNKIAVIKSLRSIMNLGLKESKDIVESVPVTLKEGINKDEANNFKKVLEEVGAIVEIK